MLAPTLLALGIGLNLLSFLPDGGGIPVTDAVEATAEATAETTAEAEAAVEATAETTAEAAVEATDVSAHTGVATSNASTNTGAAPTSTAVNSAVTDTVVAGVTGVTGVTDTIGAAATDTADHTITEAEASYLDAAFARSRNYTIAPLSDLADPATRALYDWFTSTLAEINTYIDETSGGHANGFLTFVRRGFAHRFEDGIVHGIQEAFRTLFPDSREYLERWIDYAFIGANDLEYARGIANYEHLRDLAQDTSAYSFFQAALHEIRTDLRLFVNRINPALEARGGPRTRLIQRPDGTFFDQPINEDIPQPFINHYHLYFNEVDPDIDLDPSEG